MTISVKDGSGSPQTIKTIDDLAADGGQATIGAKGDTLYSDGTGAASGSVTALLKGAYAKLAALVTNTIALGRHNSANSTPVVEASLGRQVVAPSASATALGTGAVGDYLDRIICVVATAATSQVQVTDGSGGAVTVLPNAVGPGVGTYTLYLGFTSASGAWKITTAAGVTAICCGDFTP